MKKENLILTCFIALQLIIFTSCKNDIQYKYSNNAAIVDCSFSDDQLINEAFYEFESYISEHYTFIGNTLAEGYHNYIKTLFDNREPASEYFSDHLNNIVDILQEEKNLWSIRDNEVRLNYNSEAIICLIESINDPDIKNIISTLTASNTVKPKVLAPLLFEKKHLMDEEDRALATYVALDMFYTKLIHMKQPGYVAPPKYQTEGKIDSGLTLKKMEVKKDSTNKN